jgi:exodeoxyribonuclease VII large subunit
MIPSPQQVDLETGELQIWSVHELNQHVQTVLEHEFACVWICGEISNLSRPSSGHYYFTLKDEYAQVRCAMFKMQARNLGFNLENGQKVTVYAQVSLYTPRGDYQLIIHSLELAGLGALQQAFEQLKQKLSKEGLFDAKHKKPFPLLPHCIGVISSPSGAVIRDILHVLQRRFPDIPVILYPSEVQGKTAAANLLRAIQIANRRNECDVLILARGGGSLEDLWPFNDEALARGIFASDIPIISAVGHEVDYTIADFVADLRAPTPSAAAEIVVAPYQNFIDQLQQQKLALQQNIHKRWQTAMQQLDQLQLRLRSPQERLGHAKERLLWLQDKLLSRITMQWQQRRQQLVHLAQVLQQLSPLNTMKRGYSVVWDQQKNLIADGSQLRDKMNIRIEFAQNAVECEIDKVKLLTHERE